MAEHRRSSYDKGEAHALRSESDKRCKHRVGKVSKMSQWNGRARGRPNMPNARNESSGASSRLKTGGLCALASSTSCLFAWLGRESIVACTGRARHAAAAKLDGKSAESELRTRALTHRCTCHAAVGWTGAEAPMSSSARRRHVSCRSLLPMQLLGAATAAPRRFVVCEAGVQVNGGSVRPKHENRSDR